MSASVAIISAVMVITRRNAVHALLYLVVSLLSVGLNFFVLEPLLPRPWSYYICGSDHGPLHICDHDA